MKIPSLFKSKEMWPSCKHPKTLSFRAGDDMFKTVNSVFFDPSFVDGVDQEKPENYSSRFTNSSETASFSTDSVEYYNKHNFFEGETLEDVIRGVVRSETRLFFEPGGDTSSILEETKPGGFPFKESVVLTMESDDPYVDFRRSMEEMVESHGVNDWECLEELLGWYLRVNGKKHHEFIVSAFADLLFGIAANSNSSSSPTDHCPCSDSASFASALSCFSTSSSASFTPSGSLQRSNEIEETEEEETNLS